MKVQIKKEQKVLIQIDTAYINVGSVIDAGEETEDVCRIDIFSVGDNPKFLRSEVLPLSVADVIEQLDIQQIDAA